MRAQVIDDFTKRTIVLKIEDGPDLKDLAATWRKSGTRVFRAQIATIIIHNYELTSIRVAGHLVLKNGRLSEKLSDAMTWMPDNFRDAGKLSDAPEWVRELCVQAPLGITEHTWTLEEVAGR